MPSPPPEGLSEAAARLWPGLAADVRAVTGGAEVDMLLLADVLRAMDRLAGCREVLDREGLTTEGSTGQTRPHPLLVAESVLRREIAAGFERLHLTPGVARHNSHGVRDGRITPAGGRLR